MISSFVFQEKDFLKHGKTLGVKLQQFSEKVVNFEYGNFVNLTSKKVLKVGNLVPHFQHIVTVREGDECPRQG